MLHVTHIPLGDCAWMTVFTVREQVNELIESKNGAICYSPLAEDDDDLECEWHYLVESHTCLLCVVRYYRLNADGVPHTHSFMVLYHTSVLDSLDSEILF